MCHFVKERFTKLSLELELDCQSIKKLTGEIQPDLLHSFPPSKVVVFFNQSSLKELNVLFNSKQATHEIDMHIVSEMHS